MEAAEDTKTTVVEEMKTAIAALTGDGKASGDLYNRYMAKGIAKGSDYFQTEYDRLERLMSSAASPAKLAEIARKSSVLSAFIPSLNTEEAKAASKAPADDGGEEEESEDMQEDDMESGDAFENAEDDEEDVAETDAVDEATAEVLADAAASEL